MVTQTPAPKPMKLTIATRGSQLALWQANYVKGLLEEKGCTCTIDVISTKGDRVQDRFLHEVGGKGLFIKELEVALEQGKADLAVHSLKDMPAKLPDGFILGAVLKRHSPKDVLIAGASIKEAIGQLKEASAEDLRKLGKVRFATASLRRTNLFKKHTPDVECIGIRGNVDTRIEKLHRDGYDGLILAHASLERLGIDSETFCTLGTDWFIPSPAQGALAIECRLDHPVREILGELACPTTFQAVTIERLLLADLGGDCTMPFGCYVNPKDDHTWQVSAIVLAYDGAAAECSIEVDRNRSAADISNQLQGLLKQQGLGKILEQIKANDPGLKGDL